ncbi:beta strand repeat-containing protein [Agrococcus jejuensis]|nr:LPXTG cell wall anchor domain-containing protein [Agrococcus jejuensis]
MLALAGVTAVSSLAAPAAQAAQPAFTCTSGVVYATSGTGQITRIDAATGATSANGAFTVPAGNAVNAIALPEGGGDLLYGYDRTAGQVLRYDAATETTQTFPGVANTSATIAGAIDPATGIYYFATGGSPWVLYAFDTATSTLIGQVGTISGLGTNGDMAFDAVGNLYVVSNSSSTAAGTFARVDAPIATAAGSVAYTAASISTMPANLGQYASLAVVADGSIAIGSGTTVTRVAPQTGAILSQTAVTVPGTLADMASCAYPNLLLVEKDLPEGRYAPTDQFRVELSGSGTQTPYVGVTEGDDVGVQDQASETAGPLLGVDGVAGTFTEVGVGTTDLANYTTTWQCVDEASGTVVASGSGTSGSVSVAQGSGALDVRCTFTNIPLQPGIGLDKEITDVVDVNGNGVHDAGDQILWGFTVTNTGETTLTDVVVHDDMLAAAGIGVTCAPTTLQPGGVATCTADAPYTITAADVTNGQVVNTATATGVPPLLPPVTSPPDSTETPVGGYVVDKEADPESGTAVTLGDTITYTITVTHVGTAPVPGAMLVDDLSDVLDDATYLGDATATAGDLTFDEATGRLSWTGDLADGDVVTITYSVTVTGAGDAMLANVVTSPGCAGDCSTAHPVGSYSVVKSADPPSGSSVAPGDVVTYTLTVTQAGQAAVQDATLVDDLSDVLDDATYRGDATASAGSVAVDPTTGALTWTGDLAVGDVVTITYSVEVTGAGDARLGNVVTSPGCTTECGTEHLVGTYVVAKDADPASGSSVAAGDVVAYTLTVTQQGAGSVAGATLVDDLTAVLDDATFADDAVASSGDVAFDAATSTLTWSGDLAVGDVVTITYSVRVTGAGDAVLDNVVTSPGCTSDCSTQHLVGGYVVAKSSDPASGSTVAIGDRIDYVVTVSQTGAGAVDGATFVDDLTAVLDDAELDGDVVASAGHAAFDETTGALTWSGDLAVGDVVTVTYSVVVTGAGDTSLANVVTSPGCAEACTTEHITGDYAVAKSADPMSGATVAVGQAVAYTIIVTQRGEGAVEAALVDDLADVLDDATLVGTAQATLGTVDVDGSTLSWSGTLQPGEVATITYSVIVTADGDATLRNVVTSDGCADACSTEHPVGGFVVAKTADPASGTEVAPGDVVTYALTVRSTGTGAIDDASIVDDLSAVLDDARWNGDAQATSGSVVRDGSALVWTGDLAPGQTVTISYSVTVVAGGDGRLQNVVTTDDARGSCDPAATCTTTHRVPPAVAALPRTGLEIGAWALTIAALLVAAGAVMLVVAARRRRAQR